MSCPYSHKNTFQDQQYWDDSSHHEYNIHPNVSYTPNKKREDLKHTTKPHTRILNMSHALYIIIDEFLLLYLSGKTESFQENIRDENIEQFCLDFLSKRDADVYQYFQSLLSTKDQSSYKALALILYVKLRSLFRINSKVYRFNKPALHKYIFTRIKRLVDLKKNSRSQVNKIKDCIHNFRSDLNEIFVPLICAGFCISALNNIQVKKTETLLCWYGRLFCKNRITQKYPSQIDDARKKIEQYEEERKQMVSPYLRRVGRGGAYKAEFAQQIAFVRSQNKLCRQTFQQTANDMMSFVPPVVHKLHGIPRFPTANTVKTFEHAIQLDFIENTKRLVFAKNMPCTLSSDAV